MWYVFECFAVHSFTAQVNSIVFACFCLRVTVGNHLFWHFLQFCVFFGLRLYSDSLGRREVKIAKVARSATAVERSFGILHAFLRWHLGSRLSAFCSTPSLSRFKKSLHKLRDAECN